MPDIERLNNALHVAGLDHRQNDITRLAQTGIRCIATPSATIVQKTSHLGGEPDLSPSFGWPTWQNVPQAFLGQINLADVAPFDENHLLPTTGLLSFFYAAQSDVYGDKPDDAGAWQVIYSPDIQTLQPHPLPDGLPSSARYTPAALTFRPTLTLPQVPQAVLAEVTFTGEEAQQYDTIVNAMTDRTGPQHQLLGHANALQDDMHLQSQLYAHGIADAQSPSAHAMVAGAANWQLLLQLDSDATTHMTWGSAGMLYYWIERSALQGHDFAHTWLVQQSD